MDHNELIQRLRDGVMDRAFSEGHYAAVISSPDNNPTVQVVLFGKWDVTKMYGRAFPDDSVLVRFQRDSAHYFERHRKHRGSLGWDRGVLVDGGLFPHVLKKEDAHDGAVAALVVPIKASSTCWVGWDLGFDNSMICYVWRRPNAYQPEQVIVTIAGIEIEPSTYGE